MKTSVDLKEAAFAKFKAAADLEEADGSVAAEQEAAYNALIDEGMALDAQAVEAEKREGVRSSLHERLSGYQERATGSPMRFARTELDPRAAMSIGAQFVASETYQALIASGSLKSPRAGFRTDPVIAFTPRGMQLGAAASDVIHTESGGSAAPAPTRLPGIYAYGRPPLSVRGLFPNESTGADSLEYVQQTGFDPASGSLAVKQSNAVNDSAGLKKQSSVKWEVATAYAETIATWMATTRQALAQPDGVRSFIDNQGRLILEIEEEDQLVNGDGTRPNLSGLLDQDARLALDISAIGGMDNLDALRRARRLVKQGSARLNADFVILNPVDSEGFDLLKDDNGLYRGGNPIGNFSFNQPIWSLRRVESEAVAEGTAIVGSSAAATVFERQPITVLTADQHSDFFIRNLVVILFEERLAFPVYFPTGLCEVSLEDFQVGS